MSLQPTAELLLLWVEAMVLIPYNIRTFWRHSSQPISWLGTEETKPNKTKTSNTRIKMI